MTKKLSVVVPCYNVPNLLENVLILMDEVSDITHEYEIILVDDGSDDFPYVGEDDFPHIGQNDYIKVITHETNKGKGEALVSGFKAARGEVIAFLDADLQIPPTLLKPYYQIITGPRNPDILIGSKRHYNSQVNYPPIRRLMSWTYQTMNRLMFGLKILDTQVGIKMFKKEVIQSILPTLTIKRFAIDLEMLVAANEQGFTILEAPVQINESFSSTVNPKAVSRMIQDTFCIWWRKKFKKNYKYEGVNGRSPIVHLPLRCRRSRPIH